MALNYKIYQSNRKDKTNGQWYARVAHTGTVDTNGLASIMQANCTVKRSDILAVLSELVEVMTTELQNSNRVRLDGFGTFKLAITTTPAKTAREFTVAKNVANVRVLFMPETKIGANRQRKVTFVNEVKLREADAYGVDKSEVTEAKPDNSAESDAESAASNAAGDVVEPAA